MKKHIITVAALLASVSSLSAQGLYNIAPDYTAKESLPIKWTAGASIGVDDNFSPLSSPDDSVTFVNLFVGASLASVTPRTAWDAYFTVGARAYFDAPSSASNDFVPQVKLDFNIAHEVNERLRLVSNNYIAYESEPDFENGFASDNQIGDYLQYSVTNAAGYRWSERLGTYSGFGLRGLVYDSEFDDNNRQTFSLFHNFRYNLTQRTILTTGYDYNNTNASGSAADASSHFFSVGAEHRLSANSLVTGKVGAQIRRIDGGDSESRPFVEGAIRTKVNERLSLRGFFKYTLEEYGTSVSRFTTYDSNSALRIGFSGDYKASRRLALNAGFHYINTSFEDGRSLIGGPGPADSDQDLFNLTAGFSYNFRKGVFFTGTYNWTTSDADAALNRSDYTRNRASLGVRVNF